ncbi:hypothetical protein IX84_17035 [Phaeodactylibacter xiamenensis]|jgi:hypothetical protein|uniref:Lipoprotein n=2 Tax=Phaeodactylibacter xiamenensis TaxID=1524460 RepID=A0A098S4T9_9BACT|nr:hypothetical protein IX84_17035 [Phaeodactylibacter xiamenensis]
MYRTMKKYQSILCFIGVCSIALTACSNDQLRETEAWLTWDPPLDICSGPIERDQVSYTCSILDTLEEIYLSVDHMPQYGASEGDLEAYIRANAEICGIEEIFDGHFIIHTVVSRHGAPCVYLLSAEDVFEDSKGNLVDLINNSGTWRPGKSGNDFVDVTYAIVIEIKQGAIVEVTSL